MKDGKAYLEKLTNIFIKYRIVLIAAAAGLLLLLWPSSGSRETEREETAGSAAQTDGIDQAALEARMTALLGRVEGVGRVEVMLSPENDMELVYAQEYDRRYEGRDAAGDTGSSGQERVQVLTVRDRDGSETPVVSRRVFPTFRGALVICDGAENPGTRLRVIHAVSALTGLSSERITVIKMKG